jgi:peptidoglycan hydrolase-like protein with peptidoglycan-binding domain
LKFPLPQGHFFGLNPFDVRSHTGNDNWADENNLKHWQRQYQMRWDRAGVVTGRFDGPTQRAAVAIQRDRGLPLTGVLDEDTWRAGLAGPRSTQSPDHDVPVPSPTPDVREAPEGHSEASVSRDVAVPDQSNEDTLPEAPQWYKDHGGPVGMTSKGPAVRTVRRLLGIQVRDTWSQDVSQRIRGLQKLNNLPVTGWVDTRTAQLLDALPAKR